MAVSITEIGRGGGWRLLWQRQSGIYYRRVNLNPPNTPLFLENPMPVRFTTSTTTRLRSERSCVVVPRALDPQTGDGDENSTATTSSPQEEDLWYVAKLVVGSFLGAAAIKYGSALFPEITKPNIVLALIFISSPVLVAVFLLIKESRLKP